MTNNEGERKRLRCSLMLHAYLIFHATRLPKVGRENTAWLFLLKWAELGGRPDEVIGAGDGSGQAQVSSMDADRGGERSDGGAADEAHNGGER